MAQIFISHAGVNNAEALALGSWLRSEGFSDPFIDVDDIDGLSPGDRWVQTLLTESDRCEVVILIMSDAWHQSKYCFAEYFVARGLGKRILNVLVEPPKPNQEHVAEEWQRCDLTPTDSDAEEFCVLHKNVSATKVRFRKHGLVALARGLRKAGLDPSIFQLEPKTSTPCPYPGLEAFGENDAAIFFGRELSIRKTIDQINQGRESVQLSVIWGASGIGKSSFVRAGLLPRLRRDNDHYFVLPIIRCERAAMTGDHGLLKSLQRALSEQGSPRDADDIEAELASGSLLSVFEWIRSGLHASAPTQTGETRTIVVLIDQAEELFFADGAMDEARQLLAHLGSIPKATSPVLVLLTVRTESFAAVETWQSSQRWPKLQPIYLSPMPPWAFKDVVEGPARKYNELAKKPLEIDQELTEALLVDAQGPDALPLLALTLNLLFSKEPPDKSVHFKLDNYKELGGIRGVLSEAVKRALDMPTSEPAIPPAHKDQLLLLEKVFPLLAAVDPDTKQWRRRIATHSELCRAAPEAEALIARLVNARLLRIDKSDSVEVAHEAVLRQWNLFADWQKKAGDDLATVETVRRAAAAWDGNDRAHIMLVHTARRRRLAEELREGEAFRDRFESTERDYLQACRKRDMVSTARKLALRFGALPLALLAVPLAYSLWWTQRNDLPLDYVPLHLRWMAGQWSDGRAHVPPTTELMPGEYIMGCMAGRDEVEGAKCKPDEAAQVSVDRPCAMGLREVTFLEYDHYIWSISPWNRSPPAFPGHNGFGRMHRPVINVTWEDAQAYVAWLSKRTGQRWRLPTEREWEYAARAGTATAFPWGNAAGKGQGNCYGCDDQFGGKKTASVATYKPNAWGIFDTAGNVAEWVADEAEEGKSDRVLRGGSWNDEAGDVRSARRSHNLSNLKSPVVGFRVCRDPPVAAPSQSQLPDATRAK